MAKTYASETSGYGPIGPRQTPVKGTDSRYRRIYVLAGNTDRVMIGTCGADEISDILRSTFRDNGLTESVYYLSMPLNNSASYLEELRKFCSEHGEEISPSVYRASNPEDDFFQTVSLYANSLMPGGWL